MKQIARIHSDFSSKFGIPRQSGLAASLRAQIVFEPEYRHPDAVRGIGGILTYLADLGILRNDPRQLVLYRAPAAVGRQHAHGGVCYSFALPSQPHRPVLCPAGGDPAASSMGPCPLRIGGGFDGRHASIRHQAVPSHGRLSSGGFRRLLRSGRPAPCWRWRSPNDGTPFSLTDVCRLCRRCWPWIPGRRISMTRIGFTASLSRAAKFVLQCGMGSDRLRC